MSKCSPSDTLTLDLRRLYGSEATAEDKAMRGVLAKIDETPEVGDGNFKINTSSEFKAVRDALETERPDLFTRFLEIASRRTDPTPKPTITTAGQARAEVQNFMRSSWARRVLTNAKKNKVGDTTDCGTYFAVRVPNYFGLGKHEMRVDKHKGKVTEVHDLNFWGDPMGGYNSHYRVDERY